MFHDIEQERQRLSDELLEEEREQEAQALLEEDDDSFPPEVEEFHNYANGYGRQKEQGLGGLIALACMLGAAILIIAVYWILRLTGVP